MTTQQSHAPGSGIPLRMDEDRAQSTGDMKAPAALGGAPLLRFESASYGLALDAPASWQDESDEEYFQVVDPETDTQFTASAFTNPGVTRAQWTDARLASTEKGMPFLRPAAPRHEVQGAGWTATCAEYTGTFPEAEHESRYLVLCLWSEGRVLSMSVLAKADVFAAQEALYRWLLQEHLHFNPPRPATA